MNKKIINVFGALYISLILMNVLILLIINNWVTTLLETMQAEAFNFPINIAFLGIFVMIPSTYLLFKKNLTLSSTFGFIGNSIQLIIYLFLPILVVSYRYSMELDEFILFNNGYGSISVFYLLCICLTFLINIIPLFFNRFKPDLQENALIRKKILDLGIKYPRLQVKEIAEMCKVDENTKIEADTIIRIIREMIKNNEIYAEYYKKESLVVFDQQLITEEIDQLMESYRNWEEKEKKID